MKQVPIPVGMDYLEAIELLEQAITRIRNRGENLPNEKSESGAYWRVMKVASEFCLPMMMALTDKPHAFTVIERFGLPLMQHQWTEEMRGRFIRGFNGEPEFPV